MSDPSPDPNSAMPAATQADTQVRASLETQLKQHPGDVLAMRQLCQLADRTGDYGHAVHWLCQSLESHPALHQAYGFLGYAMCKLGQFSAGLECFDKAIALNPSQAAYFLERAAALAEMGRQAEAVQAYDQAIALDPNDALAHAYRGAALLGLGQANPAIESFHTALALDAQCVAAYLNRGNAYLKQQDFQRALADYDQAIRLQANHALAHANRGVALKHLHRLDESMASMERAIALDPHYKDAQFNLALTQLLRGDLRDGFRGYHVRWQTPTFAPIRRNFAQPLWLGETSIAGKRLLVHNEQGLGDSIQFARFISLAARAGAQVIYEVEKPLFELFQPLEGVHQLVRQREPLPEFDLYCPVMSLPVAFGCTLESLPAPSAYLQASNAKRDQWAARLGAKNELRVGLVWSGSATHQADLQRSIALSALLSALPAGLDYVSLQKELRENDAQVLATQPQIRHFGAELNDFSDTAALCSLMDVVVAVDTSVAHLAGALGVKTLLLLPHLPDWRWLLDRSDSPWYPSMQLLRQSQAGDWEPVLQQLFEALEQQS